MNDINTKYSKNDIFQRKSIDNFKTFVYYLNK